MIAQWILAARVVRGDDDHVGKVAGDLAHQRALLTVAVAAGPEDHDHAPFGELTCRPEHVVERVRLMGVVDHDGEGLPFVDRFESARHALERGDPGGDVVLGDVEQDCGRDHAEDVLDVEAATEFRLESRSRRP